MEGMHSSLFQFGGTNANAEALYKYGICLLMQCSLFFLHFSYEFHCEKKLKGFLLLCRNLIRLL